MLVLRAVLFERVCWVGGGRVVGSMSTRRCVGDDTNQSGKPPSDYGDIRCMSSFILNIRVFK